MLRRLVLLPILCIAVSCSENPEQKSVKQIDVPVKKETVSPIKEKPAPDSVEIYRMKLSELQKEGEIVIDSVNNLVWMRKDFSYLNNRFAKNWNEAMSWADSMNAQNYLGFDDWYVPSIKEYKTMNRNSGDRKVYREKFLEMDKDYSWGKGAYAFWASNEKGKYVASYISFHDGFATSGDKNEQKNAVTGEDFGMSVRLVRRVWRYVFVFRELRNGKVQGVNNGIKEICIYTRYEQNNDPTHFDIISYCQFDVCTIERRFLK